MKAITELAIILMACAACFFVGMNVKSWIAQQPDRTKPFTDLIEAAEEMYEYCDSWHWKYGAEWKAAIDAAKAELERGKR